MSHFALEISLGLPVGRRQEERRLITPLRGL